MNQKKIGEFLKHLRKEKGLTQEQLAEHFYVSSRTVSRWETGNNMPDIDMLIELADFYDVDIREIIDGERKSENMDNETKDTLKKVAEYATEENNRIGKKIERMMTTSALATLVGYLLFADGTHKGYLNGIVSSEVCATVLWLTIGVTAAFVVLNLLHSRGVFYKIASWKKNRRKNKNI